MYVNVCVRGYLREQSVRAQSQSVLITACVKTNTHSRSLSLSVTVPFNLTQTTEDVSAVLRNSRNRCRISPSNYTRPFEKGNDYCIKHNLNAFHHMYVLS